MRYNVIISIRSSRDDDVTGSGSESQKQKKEELQEQKEEAMALYGSDLSVCTCRLGPLTGFQKEQEQ